MIRTLNILLMLLLLAPACTTAQQQFTTTKKKAIKAYQDGEKCYNTFSPRTGMPDYLGAEKNFKNAIKIDPNFIEAYIFLGQIYDEMGKDEDAIGMYKKSLDINPSFYPATFYILAKIEHRIGKYQDAMEHINQYLKRALNLELKQCKILYPLILKTYARSLILPNRNISLLQRLMIKHFYLRA